MAAEPSPANAVDEHRVSTFKYSNRVLLKTILGGPDGGARLAGERVVIGGWVKSSREEGGVDLSGKEEEMPCMKVVKTRIPPCLRNAVRLLIGGNGSLWGKMENGLERKVPSVAYLQVNDGFCVSSLQVVVDSSICAISQISPAGTSVLVEGTLRQPSSPTKRPIELNSEKILHVGNVDLANYPLSKSRLPLEFLRNYPHLRPRKAAVASSTRIRSALFYASHNFFQNHGFLHVNMPIITSMKSTDTIEPFQVTTLLSNLEKVDEPITDDRGPITLQVLRTAIEEKSKKVQELKRSESDKEALVTALQDLEKTNRLALQLEEQEKMQSAVSLKDGTLNFSKDFFSCHAYLATSAHLHLESYACSLGNVYSFGPTFQAEKSQTKRSLAETWMVEITMAFSELKDVMNCAEDCAKFLCQWMLDNCMEDMNLLSKAIDKTNIFRLQLITSSPMEKVTYTEAINILNKVTDAPFKTAIEWGHTLTEEHESYLVDEFYKKAVIIHDHPKETKPFYVRLNNDGKTVASFDMILPKAGNFIRGSQREERLELMNKRIQELGLNRDQFEWYLDIRKHGTAKHSGFSFGFERLVMFTTGIDDARDSIPFPRTFGTLTF